MISKNEQLIPAPFSELVKHSKKDVLGQVQFSWSRISYANLGYDEFRQINLGYCKEISHSKYEKKALNCYEMA